MNHFQKRLLIFLIAILGYFNCVAQPPKKIANLHQLTDSITALVKQYHIPGLMVGITTKNADLYSGTFGYADVIKKRLVDQATLFRMGSITKSLIAVAILELVEQG
ncbi:hypothetical protein GCM10027037_26970 [Mucilaginibacter koreensis]